MKDLGEIFLSQAVIFFSAVVRIPSLTLWPMNNAPKSTTSATRRSRPVGVSAVPCTPKGSGVGVGLGADVGFGVGVSVGVGVNVGSGMKVGVGVGVEEGF